MDFFAVEVATLGRLVTYYVLIVVELSTRRVQIAGCPGPAIFTLGPSDRNLLNIQDLLCSARSGSHVDLMG